MKSVLTIALALLVGRSVLAQENEFTVSLWARMPDYPQADAGKGKDGYGLFHCGWSVWMTIGSQKSVSAQAIVKDRNGKDVNICLNRSIAREVKPGEWNHFAVTYSVSRHKFCLYVNGILADSRAADYASDVDLGEIKTGGLHGGYMPFSGEIRGLRKERRALTAEEIAQAEAQETARVLAEAGVSEKVALPRLQEVRHEALLLAADRRLAGDKKLYWGVVDPLGPETYLPDSDLDENSIGRPLQVCAAKGEYEAASLVVRSVADLPDFVPVARPFSVRTKDGRAAASLPADIVDTRVLKVMAQSGGGVKNRHIRVPKPLALLHDDALVRVDFGKMRNDIRLDRPQGPEYVDVSQYADIRKWELYTSAAEWPIHDARSIRPLLLKKRFGTQYWFTFHVPPDAKPGLYRSQIDLTSGKRVLATVPVKLRVLPFRLPEPRTNYDLSRKIYPGVYYRHIEHALFDPNAVGSITSRGRNEAQFRAELCSLREHGILYPTLAMEFALPGWTWNSFESAAKGGSERVVTDAQRAYFRRVIAIMREEGFPMDMLFLHSGGNWGFRTQYGQGERTTGEHRAVLARVMKQTFDMVREAAGPDVEMQFYGVDEAQGERLTQQYACWKDIRELGGKIFTTGFRRYASEVAPRLDTLISFGMMERRVAKIMHEHGGRVWSYGNPQVEARDSAYEYRRNHGFGLYSENYDGFATYAWNSSATHPWNDFDNPHEPDMALVIGTADGVVDTPAHEGYREAVDDIRYATLLRLCCRERPGPAADEAVKLLDSIDMHARDYDPGLIRLRVIDAILKIRSE